MRTVILYFLVAVWFFNLALGAGAGYAALRLWSSRHQDLIRELGLFLSGFVVDTAGSAVLIFVANGVTLTWKFTAVWFGSALLSNLLRTPLILVLIRGPKRVSDAVLQTAGELAPAVWHERFDRLEVLIQSRNEEMAQMIDNEKPQHPNAPPPETPSGPPSSPPGLPDGPLDPGPGEVPIPPVDPPGGGGGG